MNIRWRDMDLTFMKPLSMDYDPLELFGKRLVELRRAKGWSQEKLALESGLARSYVGGIERGQRHLARHRPLASRRVP